MSLGTAESLPMPSSGQRSAEQVLSRELWPVGLGLGVCFCFVFFS